MCFLSQGIRGSYRNVILYTGRGTCGNLGDLLASRLKTVTGVAVSKIREPAELQNAAKLERALFCIGGGNALHISWELRAQVALIKHKINLGGWHYLGVCAGASLACNNFHFNVKDNHHLNRVSLNPAKLKLLNLLPHVEAHHGLSAPASVVSIVTNGGVQNAYFHDGPYFASKSWNTTRLCGFYPNGLPAYIEGPSGMGQVTLFGFHPEVIIPPKLK